MKTHHRERALQHLSPLPSRRQPGPTRIRSGFTLIELLVVMGIIALLVAMLFPAIGAARQAANRAKAEQEVKSIETAEKAFVSEYGKFPLQGQGSSDYFYADTPYDRVMAVLRGSPLSGDTQWNARRIVFLEVADSSFDDNGKLVDPWGNRYQIYVDNTFDNKVDMTGTGYPALQGHSVAVWSYGPDGKSGTAAEREDDIVSWGK